MMFCGIGGFREFSISRIFSRKYQENIFLNFRLTFDVLGVQGFENICWQGIQMVTETSNNFAYVELNLNDIVLPPKLIRRADSQISELAASVAAIGVLHPPIVQQTEDGKYMLVSGYRRLLAARGCGIQTLTCRVINNGHASSLISLSENVARKDLNAFDLAQAFQDCIDQTGISHRELSKIIGKHESYVSQVLGLLSLHETIQRDHRVHNLVPLRNLVPLKKIVSSEMQIQAYKQLLNDRRKTKSKRAKRNKNSSTEESSGKEIQRLEKLIDSQPVNKISTERRETFKKSLELISKTGIKKETPQLPEISHPVIDESFNALKIWQFIARLIRKIIRWLVNHCSPWRWS
jgi:ParB/RepB/Spo0J family partition protein